MGQISRKWNPESEADVPVTLGDAHQATGHPSRARWPVLGSWSAKSAKALERLEEHESREKRSSRYITSEIQAGGRQV